MAGWVLRERFANDGGAIAWDRLGAGPPVVLVHATPWSSWTWRRIAPRLAERFTVYVFDLLGFGASEQRAGEDLSLAGHGTRLATLSGDVEDALAAPWLGPAGQSAFYRQIAQGVQRDTDAVEPLYGRIAAPTRVVWGSEDRWIPAERGEEPDALARLLLAHLG